MKDTETAVNKKCNNTKYIMIAHANLLIILIHSETSKSIWMTRHSLFKKGNKLILFLLFFHNRLHNSFTTGTTVWCCCI